MVIWHRLYNRVYYSYFVKREDEITIGDLLLTIIFILSSWLCVLLEFIAFRKEILKTVIWRRKNE